MDPFTIAAIAAPIVGGVLGNQQAGAARRDANNAINNAIAQFQGIEVPDIEKMKLALEQYTSAGTLSPEMIELINQQNTAYENVSVDPRLKGSQLDALSAIEQVAQSGMTEADKAAFELARRNAAADNQAKQAQVLQNFQQRGQGGQGAELLASLTAAQNTSDRLQQAQLEEAKAKQAARMQALQQQASMSGNIRSADYQEQQNLAAARDAISAANARNAQSVATTNTQARNQAQASNLTNAQNIRNANTGLSNDQQKFNKNLQQQDFSNRMDLAGARANAYTGQANARNASAAQTAGMYAGIGQGAGDILSKFVEKKVPTFSGSDVPGEDT